MGNWLSLCRYLMRQFEFPLHWNIDFDFFYFCARNTSISVCVRWVLKWSNGYHQLAQIYTHIQNATEYKWTRWKGASRFGNNLLLLINISELLFIHPYHIFGEMLKFQDIFIGCLQPIICCFPVRLIPILGGRTNKFGTFHRPTSWFHANCDWSCRLCAR